MHVKRSSALRGVAIARDTLFEELTMSRIMALGLACGMVLGTAASTKAQLAISIGGYSPNGYGYNSGYAGGYSPNGYGYNSGYSQGYSTTSYGYGSGGYAPNSFGYSSGYSGFAAPAVAYSPVYIAPRVTYAAPIYTYPTYGVYRPAYGYGYNYPYRPGFRPFRRW